MRLTVLNRKTAFWVMLQNHKIAWTPRAGGPALHPGAFGELQEGEPTASGQPVPVVHHPLNWSWCSERTSCIPVCTHWVLSWHWAPLKRTCLLLGIYTHWQDFPWTSAFPDWMTSFCSLNWLFGWLYLNDCLASFLQGKTHRELEVHI